MNNITMNLSSPLFTGWSPQYIRLRLAGVEPAAPLALAVDGVSLPFQYTGTSSEAGAEILVKLGFTKGETRELVFSEANASGTDLSECEIPFDDSVMIGTEGRGLMVSSTSPFLGFAGFPMQSQIRCDHPLLRSSLARVCDGPLFTDYRLVYDYGENRAYTLRFRCYKEDPYIEVEEQDVSIGHEASVSKIGEEQLFYLTSRGLTEAEASTMIVGGFIEPLVKELPMEYAVEMNRLIQLQMEGSVG